MSLPSDDCDLVRESELAQRWSELRDDAAVETDRFTFGVENGRLDRSFLTREDFDLGLNALTITVTNRGHCVGRLGGGIDGLASTNLDAGSEVGGTHDLLERVAGEHGDGRGCLR